jgi:hypothetical protein
MIKSGIRKRKRRKFRISGYGVDIIIWRTGKTVKFLRDLPTFKSGLYIEELI